EHHVAGGVADEQEVDACGVEDLGALHVVAREARDADARLLRLLEVPGAHAGSGISHAASVATRVFAQCARATVIRSPRSRSPATSAPSVAATAVARIGASAPVPAPTTSS